MLCSGHFRAENKELREKLATFAKQLATEVIDPDILDIRGMPPYTTKQRSW